MSKIERFIVYGILAVSFIVLAFFDLSITQALYSPSNGFGQAFECIAEIPAYIVGVFGLSLIARHHPKIEKKAWNVFLTVLFIIFAVGLSLYAGRHTMKLIMRCALMTEMKTIAKYGCIAGLGLAYFAAGFGCSALVKKQRAREAFLFGVFVVAVFAINVLVMQALKMIWLRPRYRTLVAMNEVGIIDNPASYWLPAYKPQFFTSFKKYQVGADLGVRPITESDITAVMSKLGITKWAKEEFYSFPSGHTLNTVGLIALSALPYLFPKLQEKKRFGVALRIVIYVLAVTVALSRIVRGAHNPTDVIFGFFLGVLIYDLVSTFLYKKWLRVRFAEKKEETPVHAEALS